jgi:sulfide:quinone oxidoreductase
VLAALEPDVVGDRDSNRPGHLLLRQARGNATSAQGETFPFDQSKERHSMYQLKKRGLPLLYYWQGMMRGRT